MNLSDMRVQHESLTKTGVWGHSLKQEQLNFGRSILNHDGSMKLQDWAGLIDYATHSSTLSPRLTTYNLCCIVILHFTVYLILYVTETLSPSEPNLPSL
jgi:hypothetical protein